MIVIKLVMKKRQVSQKVLDHLAKARLKAGRKPLTPEQRAARQRRVVFQARMEPEEKIRIDNLKQSLGFKSYDQLIIWLLEKGEKALK